MKTGMFGLNNRCPDSDWLLKQVYENYIESDWETSHGGLGVLCVI